MRMLFAEASKIFPVRSSSIVMMTRTDEIE